MSMEFQWKGHNIQVQSQPSLKYLWSATETVVKVDGTEIGRSGGLAFHEKIIGSFSSNGQLSELILELRADLITFVSVPYKLQINRRTVSQGRLRIDKWLLFFVPMTVVIALLTSIIL